MNARERLLIASILLCALALRLAYPAWDGLLGAHPDERNIVMAAGDLRGGDPYLTGDPYAPRVFPYGHVPLYLLAAVGGLTQGDADPFEHLLLTGRRLSALADSVTVALTYALARRVAGRRAALWAAAAYGLAVLPVQLAHFYAVDTLLTMFVTASLLCAVWRAQGGPRWCAWLGAALAGLAVGTKITGALVLAPWVVPGVVLDDRLPEQARGPRPGFVTDGHKRAPLVAVFVAVFSLTNPFTFIRFPVFLQSLASESAMAGGALDVPYTRQYAGTWPYVYQAEQLLRWGLGPALGVAALAGLAYALVWSAGAWRRRGSRATRPRSTYSAAVVLLAYTLPYALIAGAAYAKFTRYVLPVVPVLCVFAALLLARVARRARWAAVLLGALALAWSGGHSLALVSMYGGPHPWVSASAWIYAHVPPGAALVVEAWDDALPFPLSVDGRPRDSGAYRFISVDPFAPDSPAALARALSAGDYLLLASRRGYGTIPRLAGLGDTRYAVIACYYRRLFAGELGYARVTVDGGTRVPRLGALAILDGGTPAAGLSLNLGNLDESYSVYDHPQVYIFRNEGRRSAGQLQQALEVTASQCYDIIRSSGEP